MTSAICVTSFLSFVSRPTWILRGAAYVRVAYFRTNTVLLVEMSYYPILDYMFFLINAILSRHFPQNDNFGIALFTIDLETNDSRKVTHKCGALAYGFQWVPPSSNTLPTDLGGNRFKRTSAFRVVSFKFNFYQFFLVATLTDWRHNYEDETPYVSLILNYIWAKTQLRW